jgi:hypothetical protein
VNPEARAAGRVLEPLDRLSEVIFGVIMALTFTGAISVSTQGREEIRTLLVGALGCNTAWGIVDGVMYLLTTLLERGHLLRELRAVREAPDPETGRQLLSSALPPLVGNALEPADYERLRKRLAGLEDLPGPRLTWRDFRGALGVFLLVFLSTFPLVIPFAILSEPHFALRVSNAIALVLLFVIGVMLAGHAGWPRIRTGLIMAAVGVLLVAIALVLGG